MLSRPLSCTPDLLPSFLHSTHAEPVPRDVPHYYTIITKPMDLETVAKRLKRHHYSHPEQAMADIRQIWVNCHTFNDPSAPFYDMVSDRHREARGWVHGHGGGWVHGHGGPHLAL